MAKPATEARLAAAAKGFTQVIGRGNASIITKDPSTGKCCFDAQVGGGWHYGAGLETDTTLEQDADQNYWKMVKALYNIRVRKSFNAGDLVRWTDPTTGQYVILQPNNLSWVEYNPTTGIDGSQQFISSPAAVTGQVTDDVALWNAAYGAGRHFRYQAGPLRLTKHLIIDAAANLPAATVSNPYLEIAFVMTPSSGVSLLVDGVAWDKKIKKNTANAIEFRTSGGVTFWSFAAPTAHDSSGNPETGTVAGIMQVRKQGGNLIVAVRFPKNWIDAAVFPIMLDPAVDYQVDASANDGVWRASTLITSGNLSVGGTTGSYYRVFVRWDGVTIPVGATINAATVSMYYHSKTSTAYACPVYFEDSEDPSAPTTYGDVEGRTLTTATVDWTPGSDAGWNTSPSLVSIIQELVDSYNFSVGNAMLFLWRAANPAWTRYVTYIGGTTDGPKLHIEYTEAASGSLVIPTRNRTFNALLVR